MLPSGSDLAQASHQPGHIVPRPKRRKSLTKTPSASSSCLETWSSILNRQNLAQAYNSTLLCLKEVAPSSTDENFRTHLNVKQILFETYMCKSRFGFSWLLSSCIPSRPHLPCPGCGSPDFVSSDRSSYSDDVLLYIQQAPNFFEIFTQSIDAIDVTSVTLSP